MNSFRENTIDDLEIDNYVVKESICVRFEGIPLFPEIYKHSISSLDVKDLDRFIVVNATVIRVANRKSSEKSKIFRCIACGYQTKCYADHANMNKIQTLPRCPNRVTKQKKGNPFFDALNQMRNRNSNNFQRNNFQGQNENGGGFGGNKGKKTYEDECGCPKFEPVNESQEFVDYQEIKLQESFRTIKPGNIPRTIWVILEVKNRRKLYSMEYVGKFGG